MSDFNVKKAMEALGTSAKELGLVLDDFSSSDPAKPAKMPSALKKLYNLNKIIENIRKELKKMENKISSTIMRMNLAEATMIEEKDAIKITGYYKKLKLILEILYKV